MMVSDLGVAPGRRSGRKESCGAILKARFVRAAVDLARLEAAKTWGDDERNDAAAVVLERMAERVVDDVEVVLVRRRAIGRTSDWTSMVNRMDAIESSSTHKGNINGEARLS
jgi:hypothetical protein